VWLWLWDRRDEFARTLAEGFGETDWAVVARRMAAAGVRNKAGKPPPPDQVRNAWLRVRETAARMDARLAGKEPEKPKRRKKKADVTAPVAPVTRDVFVVDPAPVVSRPEPVVSPPVDEDEDDARLRQLMGQRSGRR